jgi:hypothetical protein
MAEWGEGVYDDVMLGDMVYDEEEETYFFPCPCGDKFFITLVSLPFVASNLVLTPFCVGRAVRRGGNSHMSKLLACN